MKIIPLTRKKNRTKLIKETKEKFCIRLFRNSHHENQFNLLLSNVSKIEGSDLIKKVYVFFMLYKLNLLYLTLTERMITFSSPHKDVMLLGDCVLTPGDL